MERRYTVARFEYASHPDDDPCLMWQEYDNETDARQAFERETAKNTEEEYTELWSISRITGTMDVRILTTSDNRHDR